MLPARPDPRTLLLYGVAASASAVSGPVPAAGVLLLSGGLAAFTGLPGRRLFRLAGSFALLLVLVPFAPGAAARAILQGFAVSVAVVVAVSAARWDRLLAVLQALGAGRHAVAFLAIALAHLSAAGRDARRALDALRLRGAFGGARTLARGTSLLLARELHRALERADRTADALALRGFSGRVPPLPRWAPGAADLVPAAAALLAIALALGSRLPWSR